MFEIFEKQKDNIYAYIRVVFGLMFLLHSIDKFFVNGLAFDLTNKFAIAGVLELIGGTLILLGLFTRIGAVLGTITVLGALALVHIPMALGTAGFNPLANGAELPLLYLGGFLLMLFKGNGKYSLEQTIFKSEKF